MKKVALYGKYIDENDRGHILTLLNILVSKGVEVVLEEKFYKRLRNLGQLPKQELQTFAKPEELNASYDLFISLGGDGTLLKAATFVFDSEIPILGINTGRLGFLASYHHENIEEQLEDIFKKNYTISQRSLIQLKNITTQSLRHNFAVNEVAIMRKETTSMIAVKAYLGDELLNTFWADGLIVATPTGSTGYSLSCGGPIISPANACFVITPIAPHNLNVRPIVIPDHEKIRLIVESRAKEYNLTLDSRMASFTTDVELELGLAPFKVNLIQSPDHSYPETLRQKLFWGRDNRS